MPNAMENRRFVHFADVLHSLQVVTLPSAPALQAKTYFQLGKKYKTGICHLPLKGSSRERCALRHKSSLRTKGREGERCTEWGKHPPSSSLRNRSWLKSWREHGWRCGHCISSQKLLQLESTSQSVCSRLQTHRGPIQLGTAQIKGNSEINFSWWGLGSHRSVRTTGARRWGESTSHPKRCQRWWWALKAVKRSITYSIGRATGDQGTERSWQMPLVCEQIGDTSWGPRRTW